MIVLWFLAMFFFLFVLLKSADYFIDNSMVLGQILKVPSFVMGATVIAFGTSLPELAVSISAILEDKASIVSGTVIGSNISNIFFILGTALIIGKGFKVDFKEYFTTIIILIFTTALTSYFLWDNFYSITEGIISVVLLLLYVVYIVFFKKSDEEEEEHEHVFSYKPILLILLSGVGIWLGAELVIFSIQKVAVLLSIPEDLISLTIIALGTSLPELAVTIVAVKKQKYGIVLGNIIGSNIFNSLCVLGLPTVIGHYTNHPYIISEAVFTNFSIPLMLLAVVLVFFLSLFNKASKVFGYLFVLFYLLFIVGTFLELDFFKIIQNF